MSSSASCYRPTCSSPGIILTLAAFAIFYGTISLLLIVNTGRRLGLLLTGAGIFGWLTITSMLFVVYAPRGPRPADIEGLNAFEIRIIPIDLSGGLARHLHRVPGRPEAIRGPARGRCLGRERRFRLTSPDR